MYVINPKAFSDLQSTGRLICTPNRQEPPILQRHADDSTLQNHSAKLRTLVPIVEEQGERSESVTRKTWQLSAGNSSALTQPALTALGTSAGWKGGGELLFGNRFSLRNVLSLIKPVSVLAKRAGQAWSTSSDSESDKVSGPVSIFREPHGACIGSVCLSNY